MTYKVLPKDHVVWKNMNQQRDLVDNDNQTPLMKMRAAKDIENWAASRSKDKAFSAQVHEAATDAQRLRKDAKSDFAFRN